jgi:hypothetical protein
MNNQSEREQTLRAALQRDRGAATREYRTAMSLHGDPSQSDNVSDDEMVQAILTAEQTDKPASLACRIMVSHRP